MTTSAAQAGRSAARYFFMFLVGLLAGAIGVVMLMRTLEARKTWEDNWHEAAMHLMQAHTASLQQNMEQSRCSATDTLPHLQALRILANDIQPAFPDLRDDQRFSEHASQLRGAIDAALASPPLQCEGVTAAVQRIGEACKACHQDFR